MKREVWRFLLRIRFLLWQRHRHDRLSLERGLGFPLLVLPGVFNPCLFRTTPVFIDHLGAKPVPKGASLLDVGTGCGALAIAAARSAGRVLAVDIDPVAARCARLNALLNGVEDRVEVRTGDLFAPVGGERFDVILSNPPYFRGTPRSSLEGAFMAPDFAERFASGLGGRLTEHGHALISVSTDGDVQRFNEAFASAGIEAEVVADRDLISERVRILCLRASGHSDVPLG